MSRIALASIVLICLTGCRGFGKRVAVVEAEQGDTNVMDFGALELDPLTEGWHHRKFVRHKPMTVSVVEMDERAALRVETHDTASMLFRHTNISLDSHPYLVWEWKVERAIDTELDENTVEGDDHPARFFMEFQNENGKRYAEIIYGNELVAGDYKTINDFPHYVARGGSASVGTWWEETVDLRAMYRQMFAVDPAGVRLTEIAVFCDTDETGAESLAYFANVTMGVESPVRAAAWARTQIDRRAADIEPHRANLGATELRGFFVKNVVLKVKAKVVLERGYLDVLAYYGDGKPIYVSVTQALHNPDRVTDVNHFYFEDGKLTQVFDADGNELPDSVAQKAKAALLDGVEFENWTAALDRK